MQVEIWALLALAQVVFQDAVVEGFLQKLYYLAREVSLGNTWWWWVFPPNRHRVRTFKSCNIPHGREHHFKTLLFIILQFWLVHCNEELKEYLVTKQLRMLTAHLLRTGAFCMVVSSHTWQEDICNALPVCFLPDRTLCFEK